MRYRRFDKRESSAVCALASRCRSSKRCPSRDVSRDDRGGDPADSARTLACVADGSGGASRFAATALAPRSTRSCAWIVVVEAHHAALRSSSHSSMKAENWFQLRIVGVTAKRELGFGRASCRGVTSSIESRAYRSPRAAGCVTILLCVHPGSDLRWMTTDLRRRPQSVAAPRAGRSSAPPTSEPPAA